VFSDATYIQGRLTLFSKFTICNLHARGAYNRLDKVCWLGVVVWQEQQKGFFLRLQTNIPFLLNVITDDTFLHGQITTQFIDNNPQVRNERMKRKYSWSSFCNMPLLKYVLSTMGVSKESISKFSIPCLHPSWKVHTWIEICASLNHRKKTKADGSRLILQKHQCV